MPMKTPATMRHEATRPKMMMAPPMRIISVETSPIDPGILPRKASIQLTGWPVETLTSDSPPPLAHWDNGVAPEKPSAAVHTRSPEICAGQAKNKNARPASAGLRKLRPVPPKISLAMTTPKVIPNAACHSGSDGGTISANRIDVTKKPSFISCLRTIANKTSQNPPTRNTVM